MTKPKPFAPKPRQKIAEVDANAKTELATKASTDDVKGVDGKVDGVRTDLTGTQNDLKMARSELGTLIARNHEDVEQLRRLGERDYIEFTIDTKNKPQKVGAFVVELKGTNPTKKRYNVALVVDDSRIEQKNLPVDEPIFFHQGNDRRPLELVVNTVGKDKVTGYISVPKAAGSLSRHRATNERRIEVPSAEGARNQKAGRPRKRPALFFVAQRLFAVRGLQN